MKKLFYYKGGIPLIGAMFVLALAACSSNSNSSKSNLAALVDFQAVTDELAVDGIPGQAIEKPDWDVAADNTDFIEEQIGTLDFKGAASSAAVNFYVTASPKATVTYAVVKSSSVLPNDSDFKNISEKTPPLSTNDAVYFKVVSEGKKTTNYYCVMVTGLGDAPSNSTGISGVKIGGGAAISPPQSSGHASINVVNPQNYDLPSVNMSGDVALQLTRNNAGQTISWAVAGGDDLPGESGFSEFEEPASGNNLSATISSGGMADGDTVYIKVIAADEVSVLYYAFTVSVGNIARLETLTLAGTQVTFWGAPAPAWDEVSTPGAFDYQEDASTSTFAFVAVAEDGGAVAYAVASGGAAAPAFTDLAGTPDLTLGEGSILYIRVTSVSGNVTVFYKINILLKASITVLYGQPDILQGENGNAPQLDRLWDTAGWDFDVSRVNLNEMQPAFKFLNTVDGSYNATGYGHTEGRAKAFWDDGGMYVYAEMSFHDYYEEEGAASATERITVVTPPLSQVADSNAHLYDSLEIFTNERVQQFKEGGYGIQYRVAPSPEGQTIAGTNSRISGNPPNSTPGAGSNSIAVLRESGKYYSWIRKDGAKELGYSIIAYIPWIYKNDASADQVFEDGKVKTTGENGGPTVGVELQLDAVTTGGIRDAILTWNGVTGQSYNQVKNYGSVTLVTGDLAARGITRGDKDPTPVTVSFDTDGGAPSAITPITVTPGLPAGSLFPADPTKDGYRFVGWWDESVTPNARYYNNTSIPGDLSLKARWSEDSSEVLFTLADYLGEYSALTAISTSTSQHPPLRATSSTSSTITIVDGSLNLNTNSSGSGLLIMLGSGEGNLNLKPVENVYEVRISGHVEYAASGSVIRSQYVGSPFVAASTTIDDTGVTQGSDFEIVYELPIPAQNPGDNTNDGIRIGTNTAGSNTDGGFNIIITKIEIVYLQPRNMETVTVSFDTDGGTPATIEPIEVFKGLSAGGKFPASPTKDGYHFTGWWDESVTPNERYYDNTPVPGNLSLKAHWEEDTGVEINEVIFTLGDYFEKNPTITETIGSSGHLLRASSGTATNVNVTINSDESLNVDLLNTSHGLNLIVGEGSGTGNGVGMKTAENVYTVRYVGTVVDAPADAKIQLRFAGWNTDLIFTSDEALATGDEFDITVELPQTTANPGANTSDVLRITTSVNGLKLKITEIEVTDKGPRD